MEHRLVDPFVEHRDLLEGGEADPVGGRIGELDCVEFDADRLAGREVDGVVGVGDERLDVEYLEDPLEADEGGRHVEPGVGEGGERGVEPVEEEGERDDGAGIERAVQREVAAEPVDHGLGEARHEAERAHEDLGRHRRAHADVPDLAGAAGELVALERRIAEQLHERRTRRREPFGHLRRHRRVEHGRVPFEATDLRADSTGRDDEHGEQHHRGHGDLPRQVEHHDEGQCEGDRVRDHAGQRRGERTLRTDDVVVEPTHEGAGVGAVEEGDRHGLHVVEHRSTQVEDDPFAEP